MGLRTFGLALLVTTAFAVEERPGPAADMEAQLKILGELMEAMPKLPFVEARPAETPPAVDSERGITIDAAAKTVVLSATTIFDKGPVDGLEVLVCLKGGKNHEAFAYTDIGDGRLLKASALVFELPDGTPANEASGFPARGTPMAIKIYWQPDALIDPDTWVWAHGSELVRNRETDRSYPALPFIYTGSRMLKTRPANSQQEVELFMLDVTKSIAVNFDEPDALLASPFPMAAIDNIFEVNSRIAPPIKSKVRVVLHPVELPIILDLDAEGNLTSGDTTLDDKALGKLLSEHFDLKKEVEYRAIGIRVNSTTDRNIDLAARKRVVRAAGAIGAWVMPTFIQK